MAIISRVFIGLTIGLVFGAGTLVSGQFYMQCLMEDLPNLMLNCRDYFESPVDGQPEGPEEVCCTVVKTLDIPCICSQIPKEMEDDMRIDMKTVVRVASLCGKPLAHATKCGSFTVP